MKTKFIFCCFLLPLAAMVFWGCPSQEPVPEVEILPEIKDNTLFKPGTYWIYIDSLSQDDIDSVYVMSSKDTIVSQNEIYGNCTFTYNEMYIKSNYYQKQAVQGLVIMCPAPKRPYTYMNYDLTITFFCGTHLKDNIESPVKYGDYINNTTYDTSYISYSILGQSYNSVKVFSNSSVFGNNTLIPKVAYYSPHIGIIKKEMWDGKKWLLLRSHIIQ